MPDPQHARKAAIVNGIVLALLAIIVIVFFTDIIIYVKHDPCIIINTIWARLIISFIVSASILGGIYARKKLKRAARLVK